MHRIGLVFLVALGLAACEQKEAEAPPQPASLEDGDRCFAARDWTCAAANYDGYLRTYPADPTANARLALARTRSGKHEEALSAYRKAEELGVVTYDLYAGYATSLEATGDLEGAIRANRKSLEIVPNLVDVRGALAAQLVRAGQRDEAIALLEEFDTYLKDNGRPPYFTAQIASIRQQG